MIRTLLNGLLIVLAFTCAMRHWQYYLFGVRLGIYEIVLLLFIGLFVVRVALSGRIVLPRRPLSRPVLWMLVIVVLAVLSGLLIDWSLAPQSTIAYLQSIAYISVYFLGLAAVVSHLASESGEIASKVLRVYIIGAAVSSVYSVAEVTLALSGYDLTRAVFGTLSVYRPGGEEKPFYYEWADFFRAAGFAGVNAQATYVASVIPLLLFGRPFRSRTTDLVLAALCVVGLALTWSRTGLLVLLTAVLLYGFMRPERIVRAVLPLSLAVLLPLLIPAAMFYEEVLALIQTRTYESVGDIGAGRKDLYSQVLRSVFYHPLGHGVGQYYVVTQRTDEIDVTRLDAYAWMAEHEVRDAYANVHSSWINWLFEGGPLLTAAYFLFFLAVIRACRAAGTSLGDAGAAAVAGLMASGLVNDTLELFSSVLLIVLVACACGARMQSRRLPSSDTQGSRVPVATVG